MQTNGILATATEIYKQYAAPEYQGGLQRSALQPGQAQTPLLQLDEQYRTLTVAAVPPATGPEAIGTTMTAAITGKGGNFDLVA